MALSDRRRYSPRWRPEVQVFKKSGGQGLHVRPAMHGKLAAAPKRGGGGQQGSYSFLKK